MDGGRQVANGRHGRGTGGKAVFASGAKLFSDPWSTRWCRWRHRRRAPTSFTRNLIIFGQGAGAPSVSLLRRLTDAAIRSGSGAVDEFDRALFGHIGSHFQRGALANPGADPTRASPTRRLQNPTARTTSKSCVQRLVRVRVGLAIADVGRLPEKEGISRSAQARGRAVLHVSGLHGAQASRNQEPSGTQDLPIVAWACRKNAVHAPGGSCMVPAKLPTGALAGTHAALHLHAR